MHKLTNCFTVAISCYLILLQLSGTLCKGQKRIVGGSYTTIYVAPFAVQIYKYRKLDCGGTLVAERFVVTAAHCVYGVPPVHFSVIGGTAIVNATALKSTISKIIIPTDYSTTTFHMDVAVLKLRTAFTGELAKPISLCENQWNTGDTVQIYGWGKRTEGADKNPVFLYTTTVKVINTNSCGDMYRGRINITSSMFCALAPGNDACTGDSGGPAIINGQLCGVISWGVGCARSSSPGVYSNVTRALNFIRNAMLE